MILGLGPVVLFLEHLHGSRCTIYHERDYIAQVVLLPGPLGSKLPWAP